MGNLLHKRAKLLSGILIVLSSGCVDAYRPAEITAPNTYLVVDGFLNANPGAATTIRLSRTQNLSDGKAPVAETKAQVTLESDKALAVSLPETSTGIYTLGAFSGSTNDHYRLRIKTVDGKEYESEYVPVNKSPKLDSVYWRADPDGVRVSVAGHDPANNTRYYRWEYEETWEYTADYQSTLDLDANNRVIVRNPDTYRCWNTIRETNILIGSTAALTQDIANKQLTFLGPTSTKTRIRYSILVRQYALSQNAYQYYDQLAKTTEALGSLFDPQPSQVTGNVHSLSDAKEPVIGYFSAGTVESRRIFIRRDQLPYQYVYRSSCALDTLPLILVIQYGKSLVTNYNGLYVATQSGCVDCREAGGNLTKPSFW